MTGGGSPSLFKGPGADRTGTYRPILTRSVRFLVQQEAEFTVSAPVFIATVRLCKQGYTS
jgi:hypothetical protein